MRNVFAKLTDVRPGEGQAVLKTVAILFCVIAGHTLTETARDTLFLGELPPERLAAVYGVLAVLATVASRFSTVLVLRFGRRSGLLLTLMVAAYGGSMFYLLPKSHTTVFSLYVFSGLISGVAIVQFWMLASHWFTVAQGRRLFGLISAGGVCGAMGGATLAICALEFFSVDLLLLIAVGLYLVAAGLVSTVRMSDEPAGAVGPTHVERGALSRAMSSMKQQPYVARLAILLAVSTSALLLTDYMFKSVAARTFAPSDLGGFFATYYAALNGLALLVQLVLSGVVVRRLGVVTAFLVLPLLLLAGGVSIIGFGGILAVVLVTKAADGGLRHSLHRVTSELLWMPLSDRVRAETKTFVDTVMVRAAQAVTAGALLLLARYGLDDPVTLAWGMCAPLVVWAVLGVRLRRPYLALFRSSLIARPDVKHQALDLDSVEFVIESLSDREPSKAIAAIDLLANNDRARLVPALILYHESPTVLCVRLRTITTSDRKD
jgi:AAA family ATP:ADP antiporter